MDCDCMVQVCLSFGLETEMIRIFLALFKEKVAVGYSLYSIISLPLSRSGAFHGSARTLAALRRSATSLRTHTQKI